MDPVFRALEAPRRRELLRLVWTRELAAGELRRAHPGVTFGAVSQHLRVLERAGLVGVRKDGRRRLYRARQEAVGTLRAWLEASWAGGLERLKQAAELEETSSSPSAPPTGPGKRAVAQERGRGRDRTGASKRRPPRSGAARSGSRSRSPTPRRRRGAS